MAPAPKPDIVPAADAKYGRNFDPWNSVSTGHQRAQIPGPHGWRDSRNRKLQSQFRAGYSGGDRMGDTAGPNSEDWDYKLNHIVPAELRARFNGKSVVDLLRRQNSEAQADGQAARDARESKPKSIAGRVTTSVAAGEAAAPREADGTAEPQTRGIFDGLVIYVNGSTYPLISDHKLKRVLAERGARTSLHLGRRQVTHVIIGDPTRAGGGLAGGKLEKEIRRVRGCGVKFVGVEWVIDSVKAGIRLPEAGYATLKMAAQGQRSVYGTFSKGSAKQSTTSYS